MGKMFCFWCENGTVPKNVREKGYVWVHEKCLRKLDDLRSDFKNVKAILEGERSEEVANFLKRMREFDDGWMDIFG